MTTHLHFTCNVCGAANDARSDAFGRENANCTNCFSSVRVRSMVRLLSLYLFAGKSHVIKDMPASPWVKGIGMTDWAGFAERLPEKLDYENTFYTREPRLDITNPPSDRIGTLDFILSSDVFEHVEAPVERAFQGAASLLKPGGFMVLTVPFGFDDETAEHFPELFKYRILDKGGRQVLVNTTRDGRTQEYTELCFHGGEGATLEMRLFSQNSLRRLCREAGFSKVTFHGESDLESGVIWTTPWSVPLVAIR
ncbi:MAG: methyltransferase domain-containing protein [Pseudomonadota bacterium]